MTNKERLDKLKQAETLIREVEFSYEVGHPIRQAIYKAVVNTFSFMGCLEPVLREIKNAIVKERIDTLNNE